MLKREKLRNSLAEREKVVEDEKREAEDEKQQAEKEEEEASQERVPERSGIGIGA